MKVLVCGGRDFADFAQLSRQLDTIHATSGIDIIIEGGYRGADQLAAQWAWANAIHAARVQALWHTHGPAAGPKRNAAMLLLRPDLVVAFPGGSGTANMLRLARAADVETLAF